MNGAVLFKSEYPDQMCRPQKRGDVGYDIRASETKRIAPMHHGYITTGVQLGLPDGVFARLVGRSSMFRNKRLVVVESIIDTGYTGALLVPVYNCSSYVVIIQKGDRIAQIILHEAVVRQLVHVDELPGTERGEAGFGSTGH